MRLLIIGRLGGHITEATKIAMARGAKVSQLDAVALGLQALRAGQGFELVMVDLASDVPGLIKAMERERINTPVVACGIDNDSDAAVRAIKAGAKEYIPLPPDPDLIAAVLEAVAEENNEVIFRDSAMSAVLEFADRVAPSDATILINGESGTGKEVIARYIHLKSRRSSATFVSVNCAAIPDNLLESELFGHEKGAFTGAVARRIGRFEEANGGSLLLDEISEMDPRLQAKLLRAIQEREIYRLGSNNPVKVDIRLIATTNRDLAEEVQKGAFREDLFYRLNVVGLRLPALRERPADIPALATHFVKKFSQANGLQPLDIPTDGLEILRSHRWPGNVRELENTMHRAVLLARGHEIDVDAIQVTGIGGATPPASAQPQADSPDTQALVGKTVAEVERDLILDTVSHCLGNRTHAANILGISIRTLRNKLKQYAGEGLQVPIPGDSERLSV